MKKCSFLVGATMLMLSLAAQAAGPTYQLRCLPQSDSPTLTDTIHARLDLHGWREKQDKPDYQLCFQMEERQEIVTEPAPYGYYGHHYWAPPVSRVVRIPVLTLTATGTDLPMWRGAQDLDADGLDAAIRRLIDQLPL